MTCEGGWYRTEVTPPPIISTLAAAKFKPSQGLFIANIISDDSPMHAVCALYSK